MKILIADCNIDIDSWGAGELRRALSEVAQAGAEIFIRRAPHGDLPAPPDSFDRVIVSGSKTSALADAPWITALHTFIHRTLDAGIPFLGVCYGHQTLARVLGGNVGAAAQPELGWTKIELSDEPSSLTQGLPRSFHSSSSHTEEVKTLPKGFRCLARSAACAIQAMQLEQRPVFGIQFHPEKDSGRAAENPPLYNATVSATIFKNFLGARE